MKRHHQNLISGGLVAFNLGCNSLLLTPAIAQSTNTDASCLAAISQAQARILEGRTISLSTDIRDIPTYTAYKTKDRDFPANRPQAVIFLLGEPSGFRANSDSRVILNSMQFMKTIAINITNHCSSIGYVEFALPHTDWQVPFGIVNGSLKKFQCSEDWDPRSGTPRPPVRWGYYACL